MSFEWFVARRYLTARRRQAFISLISGVSILGVAVGVMALVIALALMTGVQGELRDRIVGSAAHIYVYRIGDPMTDIDAEIAQLMGPDVEAGAPAILDFGMLTSLTTRQPVAVKVKGIDPVREPDVTDIRGAFVAGSLDALESRTADDYDPMILGVDLATTLGVSVGDRVLLTTPYGTANPFGAGPRQRAYEIVGTVEFGFYDTDSSWAFVTLQSAAAVMNRQAPDFIQLKLSDLDAAPQVRARLEDQLGIGYQVQDWTEINAPLYSALWLEKVAISLAIGLIVMVAALNIVASLVLLVMEKSRDIAILKTMGASARAIRRIFMLQGLTIGLLGTTVGTVLGLIVCDVADRNRLIRMPEDVYQITYLPFRVEPFDVLIVVASAVVVCFVATIYPSRQAARLDPAEALRNQ